jgi:hypothetical protein
LARSHGVSISHILTVLNFCPPLAPIEQFQQARIPTAAALANVKVVGVV